MKKIWYPVFCIVALHAPARAESDIQQPWPVQLRAKVAQVNEIGFRLRRAVLPAACRNTSPALGAEFDHISNYSENARPAIRTMLGLTDQPQVAAVAQASPAAMAGLAQGDEILAIGTLATTDIPVNREDRRTKSDIVHDEIVGALSRGPARLTVRRAGTDMTVMVTPLILCTAHANVTTTRGLNAHEGEFEIAVSTGLIDFMRNADELALILSHEFSHSFLDHGKARNIAQRRSMERQADLVGATIAQCAGFDILTASAFWPRFGARDPFAFLRSPSHERPSTRARNIVASLAGPQPACPVSRF